MTAMQQGKLATHDPLEGLQVRRQAAIAVMNSADIHNVVLGRRVHNADQMRSVEAVH
jgi:hypothetical protein